MSLLDVLSLLLILVSAFFYWKARPYLKYQLNIKNFLKLTMAWVCPSWFDDEGKSYCQYGLGFLIASVIVSLIDKYIH